MTEHDTMKFNNIVNGANMITAVITGNEDHGIACLQKSESPKSYSSIGIGSSCRQSQAIILKKSNTYTSALESNINNNLQTFSYDKETITSPTMQRKTKTARPLSNEQSKSPTLASLLWKAPVKTWNPSKSLPSKSFDSSIGFLDLVADEKIGIQNDLKPLLKHTSTNTSADFGNGDNTKQRRKDNFETKSEVIPESSKNKVRNLSIPSKELYMSMSSLSPRILNEHSSESTQRTAESCAKKSIKFACQENDSFGDYCGPTKNWKTCNNPQTTIPTISTNRGVTRHIKTVNGKIVFADNDTKEEDSPQRVVPRNDVTSTSTALVTECALKALSPYSPTGSVSTRTCVSRNVEMIKEAEKNQAIADFSPSKVGSSAYGRRAKSWKPRNTIIPIAPSTPNQLKCDIVNTLNPPVQRKSMLLDRNNAELPCTRSVGPYISVNCENTATNTRKNNVDDNSTTTGCIIDANRTTVSRDDGCKKSECSVANSMQNFSSPSIHNTSPFGRRAKSWKPTKTCSASVATTQNVITKIKTVNGKVVRDLDVQSPLNALSANQSITSPQLSEHLPKSSVYLETQATSVLLVDNLNQEKCSDPTEKNTTCIDQDLTIYGAQLQENKSITRLKAQLPSRNEQGTKNAREKVGLANYISKQTIRRVDQSNTTISATSSNGRTVSVGSNGIMALRRTKDSLVLFQQDSVHVHNQRSPSRRNPFSPNFIQPSCDISDCTDEDSLSGAHSFSSDGNSRAMGTKINCDFRVFQKKCLLIDPSIPSPCHMKKKQGKTIVQAATISLLNYTDQKFEEDMYTQPTPTKIETVANVSAYTPTPPVRSIKGSQISLQSMRRWVPKRKNSTVL
jgi:hypothetical protein